MKKSAVVSGALAALLVCGGCVVHERRPRPVIVREAPPPVVVYQPPPRRVEVLPPQPAPEMIWIHGDWYREGPGWQWHRGYWRRP